MMRKSEAVALAVAVLCAAAVTVRAGDECAGTPSVVCADAGANQTRCTDAAHAGCVWLADTRACTGTASPCAVHTPHGEAACEAVPGCAWRATHGVWLGIAVFVGIIALLVVVLYAVRIAYTRYLLSRPAEPGLPPATASSQPPRRSALRRFLAFDSASAAAASSSDAYVPPAKNNTPPAETAPVHVTITDDDHDGDGAAAAAAAEEESSLSSSSAAVL